MAPNSTVRSVGVDQNAVRGQGAAEPWRHFYNEGGSYSARAAEPPAAVRRVRFETDRITAILTA